MASFGSASPAKAAAPEPQAEAGGNSGRRATLKMNGFAYVYILESLNRPQSYYVGLTDDLASRLAKHIAGEVPHTAKLKPWRIKSALAFRDRGRAADFERYLKSGSGRAFAKKHL